MPERRTRGDVVAAAAIAVVVVIVAALVWQHSQARATLSRQAAHPPNSPPTAATVPSELREKWHADDAAVDEPIAVGGVVVTAVGGDVTGRDPADGSEVWRYRRDLPLCGVRNSWGAVVVVFLDRRGCSQVTELNVTNGARIASRSSLADSHINLGNDNAYILAQGPRRLEVWRSDLVRTLEYGYVDAPVQPNSQPRSGCTLLGGALNSLGNHLVVLEHCPGDSGPRLTVTDPAPKDAMKPEESTSTVIPDTTPKAGLPRLLATGGDHIALYLPGRDGDPPRIAIYDNTVKLVAQYPLPAPLSPDARVQRVGYDYLVWTGVDTIAVNGTTFAPRWTATGTLGPGGLMAGKVLLPTPDGISVRGQLDGIEERRIPVSRNGYHGPIETAVMGATVVEQRGNTLHALG